MLNVIYLFQDTNIMNEMFYCYVYLWQGVIYTLYSYKMQYSRAQLCIYNSCCRLKDGPYYIFLSCNKKELNEKYYTFDIGHTKCEIIFITSTVFTACNEKKQIILKEDKLLKLIYLHMPPLVTALFYRQTYSLFEPKHILYS